MAHLLTCTFLGLMRKQCGWFEPLIHRDFRADAHPINNRGQRGGEWNLTAFCWSRCFFADYRFFAFTVQLSCVAHGGIAAAQERSPGNDTFAMDNGMPTPLAHTN